MIDSTDLALPFGNRRQLTLPSAKYVDITVAHPFWFGRRLWMAGVGFILQGAALIAAGVFLLTQISATPNLVVQIALTGGLLTLGGIVILYRASGDFLAAMRIDRQGIRVHLGWRRMFIPWACVEAWSVQDPMLEDLPAITIRVHKKSEPVVVTAAQADPVTRQDIQTVLRAFAFGKEQSSA